MQRHGVDASGNIMEMVTMLQGYWDIASRRLIDNICMLMEKDFVDEVLAQVDTQATLFGMGLQANDVKNYMKEDALVIERRKQLRERIRLLDASLEVLQKQE